MPYRSILIGSTKDAPLPFGGAGMRGIRPACRAKAVSTCAFPVELVTRADAEPLPEIETAT